MVNKIAPLLFTVSVLPVPKRFFWVPVPVKLLFTIKSSDVRDSTVGAAQGARC